MTTNNPNTPTQVAHPGQAVMRTLTALLTAAILAPLVFDVLVQVVAIILQEGDTILNDSWKATLTTFSGVLVVLAGIITRVMAIPAVNSALSKLGLGATPMKALEGYTKKVLDKNPDPTVNPTPENKQQVLREYVADLDEYFENGDNGKDAVG